MRGFLKSREGLFQLDPKTTTIGPEGCHLVLQGAFSDCIRAVIEYIEEEDSCFVLQDLNSIHGVYVNDCCIRNTVVKLEDNDIIRFGYDALPYEFLTECQLQTTINQLCPKPCPGQIIYMNGLPHLTSAFKDVRCQGDGAEEPVDMCSLFTEKAGWISGPRVRAECLKVEEKKVEDKCSYVGGNSDKNENVGCLKSEIQRLSMFESECAQKNDLIEQLRDEVTNLQNYVRHIDVNRCPCCQRLNLAGSGKLSQLEAEPEEEEEVQVVPEMMIPSSSSAKSVSDSIVSDSEECKFLNTDSEQMQPDKDNATLVDPNSAYATSRSMSSHRRSFVDHCTQFELDCTQRACQEMLRQACQMQQAMFLKDETICRLAKELECVKAKLTENEEDICILQNSLDRFEECRDFDVELQLKDRELALLRLKQKRADNRYLEMAKEISSLKEELAKCKTNLNVEKSAAKKIAAEREFMKTKCQELERLERMARVETEVLSKRLEKIRARSIQTAFAGSSAKAPDKLISDDELIDLLKKCADERAEFVKKAPVVESVQDKKKVKK